MDTNPLLGRLMKEKKEDIIHSSAYAEAQNAGKMGADSTQSFEVRRKIDENRSKIKGYQFSEVGSGVHEKEKSDEVGQEANLGSEQKLSLEVKQKTNSAIEKARNIPQKNNEANKIADRRAEIAKRFGTLGKDTEQSTSQASTQGPTRMPTRINPGISR